MSCKRPVLINFARREVRYATHFGRNADIGRGPRSANTGSQTFNRPLFATSNFSDTGEQLLR
jgi:hypothetical protein